MQTAAGTPPFFFGTPAEAGNEKAFPDSLPRIF
jgi:hypothetical protein